MGNELCNNLYLIHLVHMRFLSYLVQNNHISQKKYRLLISVITKKNHSSKISSIVGFQAGFVAILRILVGANFSSTCDMLTALIKILENYGTPAIQNARNTSRKARNNLFRVKWTFVKRGLEKVLKFLWKKFFQQVAYRATIGLIELGGINRG